METNINDFSKDKSFNFHKSKIRKGVTVYIDTRWQKRFILKLNNLIKIKITVHYY